MLWIKEVEMVESVDDLKSSRSVKGTPGPDFELLDARIASDWTKSSRIPASRKGSVWRQWKLTKKTVSFEEDRSLTWSTNTSGSLLPMILSRIMQTYLQLFFEMTMFRNSILSGTEFYCQWRNPIGWHLGKLVQIDNTRVWQAQDRIGIVQYGDSSEEGWTRLSQTDDNGEKKYRAEFENEEFWSQKRKFWNKRRGQES